MINWMQLTCLKTLKDSKLIYTCSHRYSNGLLSEDHTPQPSTPSIEEALKIIHDTERTHGSLPSGSGSSSFYLHGRALGDPADNGNHDNGDDEPDDLGSKARVDDADLNSTSTEVDTGIHVRTEDIQDGQDEDSSLKDYSDMDQDYEVRSCPLPESSSPCPSLMGLRSLGCGSPASSTSSGVRMTSFAEQKFRKRNQAEGRNSGSGSNTPESSELNLPNAPAALVTQASAAGRAATPETRSPARLTSPRDPGHILASEMVHLKMKLEEKRRAIEAQKKKVEAAFTRHRQRMGRTAFLNVVRRKGGSTSPSPVAETSSPSFSKPPSPSPVADASSTQKPGPRSDGGAAELERCKPDGAAPKSPVEEGGAEVDLTEYTRTIERLNTSLTFLQSEMQRLARQQEAIMQMRDNQAWVISPPSHSHSPSQPSPQRHLRELRSSSVAGRGGSVGSLSPILSSSATGGGGTGSPRTTHRSPSTIKRKSASFHARTPRTPRPSELKITPFSRMLNTPQSVDSLPRLRRFSPSQTQTTSFAYLGHDARPSAAAGAEQELKDRGQGAAADQAKDKTSQGPVTAGQPEKSQAAPAGEKTKEKEEERKETENAGKKAAGAKPTSNSKTLSQPMTEGAIRTTNTTGATDQHAQVRKDLIEVPLSVLKPEEGQESGMESGPDGEPGLDNRDQKMCCGFFYRVSQPANRAGKLLSQAHQFISENTCVHR